MEPGVACRALGHEQENSGRSPARILGPWSCFRIRRIAGRTGVPSSPRPSFWWRQPVLPLPQQRTGRRPSLMGSAIVRLCFSADRRRQSPGASSQRCSTRPSISGCLPAWHLVGTGTPPARRSGASISSCSAPTHSRVSPRLSPPTRVCGASWSPAADRLAKTTCWSAPTFTSSLVDHSITSTGGFDFRLRHARSRGGRRCLQCMARARRGTHARSVPGGTRAGRRSRRERGRRLAGRCRDVHRWLRRLDVHRCHAL